MIVKRCHHTGCFNPAPCPVHGLPKKNQQKTDEERRFYQSRKWTEASKRHRQHEPLCRECLKNGITRLAQMVDHIIPISEGGSKFDESNLQSLDHECHNKKRGGERKSLIRRGA